MTSRMTRAIVALAPLALLSGCISFGGKLPPSLLRLTPEQTAPAGAAEPLTAGAAVTVLVPTTTTEIATNRVPVRKGQTDLAYVKGAQWGDLPTRAFRDLLAETLRARTGRVVLDVRDYHLAPGLRLAGRIQQFGLDAGSMQVVMVYDATLQRSDSQIETRRFEARAPASAATEAGVAPALNSVANQVADQVADWVGR